jgi:hypothetical protein
MKVIKETSIRAARNSSRRVITGAVPYLTKIMEAIGRGRGKISY